MPSAKAVREGVVVERVAMVVDETETVEVLLVGTLSVVQRVDVFR